MNLKPHSDDPVFVVRPLVPRLWAIAGWVVIGLGVYLTYSLVTEGRPSPSVPAIGLAIAFGIVGSIWSATRLAFCVSAHGLEIRNVIRTWSYRWDDVAEVGFKYVGLPLEVSQRIPAILQGRTPPAIGIRLRNGKYVPAAQATAYLSGELSKRLLDVLTAEAGSHGVPVSVQASDLATPW